MGVCLCRAIPSIEAFNREPIRVIMVLRVNLTFYDVIIVFSTLFATIHYLADYSQVEDLPCVEIDSLGDEIFDLQQALIVLKVFRVH